MCDKALFLTISKTTLFCDSDLLEQHHTLGLHCRVGVIDYTSRQAYKVSVVMAPASADHGQGQNCPKTTPIAAYQGKMAC
jgi:hypothetical protein